MEEKAKDCQIISVSHLSASFPIRHSFFPKANIAAKPFPQLCAMFKSICTAALFTLVFTQSKAQITRTPAQQLLITNEDSLNAGASKSKTVLSGYGSALYRRDFNAQTSVMNLERAVLFVGHQFNSKIAFFSELELENAKVSGGNDAEISMEQAYLKFNVNARQYVVAGLFIPRIGLINENHLPVNYNGVERPIVEQLVIPSTWRELGVGFYGRLKNAPLNYSVAVMNGLNASGFLHGSGLRDGRFEGSNASANNLAVTAALQYYYKDFIFQVSGYAGGSNGLNKRASDSLNIDSGVLGLPVILGEANVQYNHNSWSAKALFSYININDADQINKTYASNTASGMYGGYAELAYDLLYGKQKKDQQLKIFSRYEMLDLNSSIPANGIYDGTEKQSHLIAGLSYLPIRNVIIKADVRLVHTGEENPSLIINPSPVRLPYKQNNQILNLGVGYSF